MHHKDEKVVVIDTTLRGDLSELLLGGDKGVAGKNALRAVAHMRSTTKLLMQAASVHAVEGISEDGSGPIKSIVAKLFSKEKGEKRGSLLDLDEHLVKVNEFNKAIPENLYLCPGGSGPQTSFPQQQQTAIVETIRKVNPSFPC